MLRLSPLRMYAGRDDYPKVVAEPQVKPTLVDVLAAFDVLFNDS